MIQKDSKSLFAYLILQIGCIFLFLGCRQNPRIDHDNFIRLQIDQSKYLPFKRPDIKKYHAVTDSSFFFKPYRSLIDSINDIKFEAYYWGIDDCDQGMYLLLSQPKDGDNYHFVHFMDETYPIQPWKLLESDLTVFNKDIQKALKNISITDKSHFIQILFESLLKSPKVTSSNMDSVFNEVMFGLHNEDKVKVYSLLKNAVKTPNIYCYRTVFSINGFWLVKVVDNQIRITLLNRRNMVCIVL